MRNLGIIIQARLGSERLPNKVLLPLPTGETVLERIVKTAQTIMPENTIVSTPDFEVVREASRLKCRWYHFQLARNVHNEICEAAKCYCLKHIVRLTADCPLLDVEDIRTAIDCYDGEYLYRGPDGRDVEIFPLYQFEKFPNDNDEPTKFFHHNGLSLDTEEDYKKICQLLSKRSV